jgi:hypothetical protein
MQDAVLAGVTTDKPGLVHGPESISVTLDPDKVETLKLVVELALST